MRNVIIGTAGHIDHGKSSLIRRLTGIDPDRWEEEKKRGITIDLGFSFFDLPSSKRVGIVDVPGHEKFIRNMLAGVSGIDLVLLVIALDEGIMPQTQEHLNILSLLKVKHGIIVFTKSDLVDKDIICKVKSDVEKYVEGTFLQDAPMVEISSITGDGFDRLIQIMDDKVQSIEFGTLCSDVRMPVDRVFSLKGVGTVITGTLQEGQINENDQLEIYPNQKTIRIRKIHNHNEEVKTAYSGQRVALNVTGVQKSDISRGDVVSSIGKMFPTMMIDVDLSVLSSSNRAIENWNRIRLYHGTKEVLCRAVLLDKDEIKPNESGFVQLRLEEQIACKYGDRFVIRQYSPVVTIGGGKILDAYPKKHKRFKKDIIEYLSIRKDSNYLQVVENLVKNSSKICLSTNEVATNIGLEYDVTLDILKNLSLNNVIEVYQDIWIHKDKLLSIKNYIIEDLEDYHSRNPLQSGMPKQQIKKKYFNELNNKISESMFEQLAKYDELKVLNNALAMSKFEINLTDIQKKRASEIMNYFDKVGIKPPALSELKLDLSITNKDNFIISHLFKMGEIVEIDEKIWISGKVIEDSKRKLNHYFNEEKELSVGDFRDLMGTSRKNAIAILEYFDEVKFTHREGNVRTKR